MIIAVLTTIIIFMGILILMLCHGYNLQLRAMRMKANINAGLWAEAEAKAHDAEIQLAKVDGALRERIKVYQDMHNLAWRAIQAAGEANNVTEELEREGNTYGNPDESLLTFHCPRCHWEERAKNNPCRQNCENCGYEIRETDEILNATEIDN